MCACMCVCACVHSCILVSVCERERVSDSFTALLYSDTGNDSHKDISGDSQICSATLATHSNLKRITAKQLAEVCSKITSCTLFLIDYQIGSTGTDNSFSMLCEGESQHLGSFPSGVAEKRGI